MLRSRHKQQAQLHSVWGLWPPIGFPYAAPKQFTVGR